MKPELLHVITTHFNPVRFNKPRELRHDFIEHMLNSNVKLTVIECTYGDRPPEIRQTDGVNHITVRADTIVWNKENLINLAVQRLPSDWKYVAWIDGDIVFRNKNWAADTVHALQQYNIVQPWVNALDLGPHDSLIQAHKSFCFQYWNKHPVVAEGTNWWKFNSGPYEYPHPGYAWATTRSVWTQLGGLFEKGAVGAGDHHMALSLIGKADRSMPAGVTDGYRKHVKAWENRALKVINGSIGFVGGTIEHMFHGSKDNRKYVDRWDILTQYKFDPDTDLVKNYQGVVELDGNKPGMAHDLDRYFKQRYEDANYM